MSEDNTNNWSSFAIKSLLSTLRMRLLIILILIRLSLCDYWSDRENFLQDEESRYFGHQITLTEKEQTVNRILMDAKRSELDEGFLHPEKFPPAVHFLLVKEKIRQSPIFKFIQKMPKGGALHIHDLALTSAEYVVQNITYRENLLICQSEEDIKLIFADPAPEDDCWKPLEKLRQESKTVKEFDAWLKSKLSLETDKPYEKYPNINIAWKMFESIFDLQTPMLTYMPVFEDYFYKGLEEFRADNVNYIEIRGTLPPVYNLNGWPLNPVQVLGFLKQIADRFLLNNPEFLGIKYIYAPHRNVDEETMYEYLEIFKMMKSLYPDFLIGFDLVGQEDLGKPLLNFTNYLQDYSEDIKFFFHAGETNWNGMSTDTNLIDAILLNTTRIGHGFAMLKHPRVMQEVKNRGIGIEVCPLSHQALCLIKDLRNHPASALMAQDFPLVVSSDAPGVWGANPLSHDFYEFFMGISSAQADLRTLKQLALNSFIYSGLDEQDKTMLILKFSKIWDSFIDKMYKNGKIE